MSENIHLLFNPYISKKIAVLIRILKGALLLSEVYGWENYIFLKKRIMPNIVNRGINFFVINME